MQLSFHVSGNQTECILKALHSHLNVEDLLTRHFDWRVSVKSLQGNLIEKAAWTYSKLVLFKTNKYKCMFRICCTLHFVLLGVFCLVFSKNGVVNMITEKQTVHLKEGRPYLQVLGLSTTFKCLFRLLTQPNQYEIIANVNY